MTDTNRTRTEIYRMVPTQNLQQTLEAYLKEVNAFGLAPLGEENHKSEIVGTKEKGETEAQRKSRMTLERSLGALLRHHEFWAKVMLATLVISVCLLLISAFVPWASVWISPLAGVIAGPAIFILHRLWKEATRITIILMALKDLLPEDAIKVIKIVYWDMRKVGR